MGTPLPTTPEIVPWRAQRGPQLEAIRKHWVEELFFGGSVAGGKSDFLLGDYAQDVPQPWGPHWHGILFRKTYPQLEELIARSQVIYPPWFPGVHWQEGKATWVWPNGATLKMRHLESATDWMNYWGHSYAWIGWDELPLWTDLTAYIKLKARLRSAEEIPNKRIRSSGNPGGPAHQAVKAYFRIDEYPLGGVVFEEGGMRRLFVRSRLADNQILLRADPGYEDRLRGLGSPELVRAWLEGDWNVVAGAYFPEFSDARHIIAPFKIPEHWTRIRGADWGSAKPFWIGWAAVSDGMIPGVSRGTLVVYREWYGWNGQPNVGCRLTAPEVGDGIRALEKGEKISDEVLDPAAFARDGGPSIAERMDLRWRRADNSRVPRAGAMGGWDQVRERLKGDSDGAQLVIFSTCPHLIRSLSSLQHDPQKPEDCDTRGDDHAADGVRYICMSRPLVRDKPTDSPPRFETQLSVNELIKRATKKRLAEG